MALHAQDDGLPHHTITYQILNHHMEHTDRQIDVHASPDEIAQLVEQGYLIRERLFSGEALQRLRDALDEVAAGEMRANGQGEGVSASRQFGGLFLRHLADKHPAFLELVKFAPTLSVARAVLGPLVQIRGFGCRISIPGEPNQETHWHQHYQVASDPLPPWFVRPHGLDCLIYLDEIDVNNGPICVRPGSHKNILDTNLPADTFDDLPDQVELHLPAGSVVMMHCMLWHRAKPASPESKNRRVLLLNYTNTWLKLSPYGTKPANGLTQQLLEAGDPEAPELLGVFAHA